jgi:hypothetical protein
MAQFLQISDLLLNLDNVVAVDSDGTLVKRIWYVGSPTPVDLERDVPLRPLLDFLNTKGLLVHA